MCCAAVCAVSVGVSGQSLMREGVTACFGECKRMLTCAYFCCAVLWLWLWAVGGCGCVMCCDWFRCFCV